MDTNTETGSLRTIPIYGFFFDEINHEYFFDGKKLPGVTETLKFGHLIDDTWFTDEAKARGTAVHTAVLYEIQGDLGEVHPKISPYVQAWLSFREMTRFDPIVELCEKRSYHPEFLYGGTPDLVGNLRGRRVLIDIKTGTSQAAQYQTAAYRELPEVRKLVSVDDRFTLKLNDDGTFRLQQYKGQQDFTIFLSALNLFKLKGGIQ